MSIWAGDRVRVRGFASLAGEVREVEHDDNGRKLLLVRFDAFLDATGDAPVLYFEDELELEPKETA